MLVVLQGSVVKWKTLTLLCGKYIQTIYTKFSHNRPGSVEDMTQTFGVF